MYSFRSQERKLLKNPHPIKCSDFALIKTNLPLSTENTSTNAIKLSQLISCGHYIRISKQTITENH